MVYFAYKKTNEENNMFKKNATGKRRHILPTEVGLDSAKKDNFSDLKDIQGVIKMEMSGDKTIWEVDPRSPAYDVFADVEVSTVNSKKELKKQSETPTKAIFEWNTKGTSADIIYAKLVQGKEKASKSTHKPG